MADPSGSNAPERPDLAPSTAARALGAILLLGLVARLALWAWAGDAPIHIADEKEYNAIAVNLEALGEFATMPGYLTSIRPPLYPAMVAGVYRVAGPEAFRAVRLVQVAIGLATVGLVYGLGATLYSRRVGVVAAGLYGAYPSMLLYDRLLLTEVLFTALLVATCLALIRARRRGSIPGVILAGVLLGLAALARSVLWPFPVILGGYLLLAWDGPIARRVLAASAFAVAAYSTIAPWSIRNTKLHRTFTVVDVMGGRNIMMGNYEYTPMWRAWDAISVEGTRAWDRVLAASDPGFDRLTQGQKDKVALRAGLAYIKAHPGLTLRRDVVKAFNFWGLERELIAGASRGYFGPFPKAALALLAAAIFGGYALVMTSGVFGAVTRPPVDWRSHALIALVIAAIWGAHALAFGHSRYHLPLIPLIAVYSANALLRAREIWSDRARWPFRLALALNILLVASWASEVFLIDFDRILGALGSHS